MPHRDELIVADPNASQEDLFHIAQSRPDLLAKIAAHPNAYPELLTWLGSLGDSHVDAALARRNQRQTGIIFHDDHRVMPTTGGSAPSAASIHSAPSATSAAIAPNMPPPAVDHENRKLILPVAILALALFLVVGVFWLMMNSGRDDEPQVSPSVETSAPAASEPATELPASETPSEDSADQTEAATDEPVETPYMPEAERVDVVSAPSGNIACRASGDGSWSCTIYQYNFTDVPPGGCDGGAVSIRVDPEGRSNALCSEDVDPGDGQLAYGQTVQLGDRAACTSTEAGMRCWSGITNEGFNMARAGITEITGQ